MPERVIPYDASALRSAREEAVLRRARAEEAGRLHGTAADSLSGVPAQVARALAQVAGCEARHAARVADAYALALAEVED
jgi:hypothetical protein